MYGVNLSPEGPDFLGVKIWENTVVVDGELKERTYLVHVHPPDGPFEENRVFSVDNKITDESELSAHLQKVLECYTGRTGNPAKIRFLDFAENLNLGRVEVTTKKIISRDLASRLIDREIET
jgi:hypothetical protein